MPKKVYQLTQAERQIIEMSWSDARYFTDYFLGGWVFDKNIRDPWQLFAHHCPQSELTVIGGFGAGKTVPFGVSYVVRCCTQPMYKFMNVADVAYQSKQMFDALRTLFMNTRMEKLIWKIVEKPYPKIVFKSDYIGESSMEFMSADENGEKILSWEGDAVHIDEAGRIQDLEDLVRNLGTRLRGQIRVPDLWDPNKYHMREREARVSMTSNSWENPYMWWRLEMAHLDPDEYWGTVLSTYSNQNLTPKQIQKFENKITTDADRDRWLRGAKPKGIGDQFSADMIENSIDDGLLPLVQEQVDAEAPGFSLTKAPKVGIHLLEMPPDEGRIYGVIGDPGQGNPPYRNAPVVLVFDITDFPKGPAVLRNFWWGFGEGSYQAFVSRMHDMMTLYQATDGCFDSTGTQKMMDELVFERDGLPIIGMNMSGYKMAYNTALKLFMDKGLIKWPDIEGFRAQLGNYKLPDTKIAQDIVAALQLTAGYLRRFYYVPTSEDEEMDWPEDDVRRRHRRISGRRYGSRSPRP